MLTYSCGVKSKFYMILILMNLLPQNKNFENFKDFLDFKLVFYQIHDRGGHQRDEIYFIW